METELKFQVPAASRAALRRAVATPTVQSTRLQAVYADTADHRLAAAGLALRLRKEGRVWKQTLKGRGDGLMQRLEHEVPLATSAGPPTLDRALHTGTAAGAALDAAIGPNAELLPLYRTDIRRLHRRVRHKGAVIELAYDCGHIFAGTHKVIVDEIEFELISGPSHVLPMFAARWAARFGLWWDVRTKSERGFRLALGLAQVPAIKAQALAYDTDASPHQAWQSMLRNSLMQALPNAAELAGGTGSAEHLHQLRVALRRLRTALGLFADWSCDADQARALQSDWRTVFTSLGAARDADVLAQTWAPQLAAAGAPAALLRPNVATADADLGQQLRGSAFSVLLLQTLTVALQGPSPQAHRPSLKSAARSIVKSAWKHARADIKDFATAPTEQRHRARRRLKRLRYALEFLAPVLKPKETRRFQRLLNAALETLGRYNDLQVAQAGFKSRTETQPEAWFAVGWLSAQQTGALQAAARSLAELRSCAVPTAPKNDEPNNSKA